MSRSTLAAVCFLVVLVKPCQLRCEVLLVPSEYASIPEAINASQSRDVILVAPGEYELSSPIRFNPEGTERSAARNLELRSEAGPGETTLRLAPGVRPASEASVLIFAGGETEASVVEGFTITGGMENAQGVDLESAGGGVRILNGSSLTMRNCIIRDNTAARGGGIHLLLASLTLTDCIIEGNTAEYGTGGGINALSSTLRLERCAVRGNSTLNNCVDSICGSAQGGGIAAFFSSVVLQDCDVSGNRGEIEGGGVILVSSGGQPALLEATNCRFSSNWAERGGALSACCPGPTTAVLTNCVISDNTAALGAGTLGTPVLDHCTVTGNAGGGALWGSLTLRSCIVWGNDGSSHGWGRIPPTAVFSTIESEEVWPGEGNTNLDPLFCGWSGDQEVFVDRAAYGPGDGTADSPFPELGPALRYNLELSTDSPCLGAGEDGTNMGADTGVCGAAGVPKRVIRVGSGDYSLGLLNLAHGASLVGVAPETTRIHGTVHGLQSDARLAKVTVTGGEYFGGVFVGPDESPDIEDCRIEGNLASNSSGGGVHCTLESSPTITRCRIQGNFAVSGGGVSVGTGAQTLLRDCVIMGNLAYSVGGGISCDTGAKATLVNCLLAGNFLETGNLGGAGYSGRGSELNLINCTVTGNSSNSEIDNALFVEAAASGKLLNCIVYRNKVFAIGNHERTVAVEVLYSDIQVEGDPLPGTGNMNVDPGFLAPGRFDFRRRNEVLVRSHKYPLPNFVVEAGDYRLAETSPLQDRGSMDGAPAADLAGRERPCGSGADIGAYESCAVREAALFLRGDSNGDETRDISDAVHTLEFLFLAGRSPVCLSAADSNDDGTVDCSDPVHLLDHLFIGTVLPHEPFLRCGEDPTADLLTCSTQPACRG